MDKLQDMFALQAHEGEDKVTSLAKAIAKHVKPGMNLYICPEGGAAMCELIRQFWGTKPNFILTMIGIMEHAFNLVHAGLIKKLITATCSHLYPIPILSAIIQDSYKKRKIEIENWTLYTHFQRLMAGALGVGFLPTRSLIGSSMAEENHESFLVIDDPFKNKGKVGLVKALNPDIALVHGWAADRYGNTIGAPVTSKEATDHHVWGGRASKNGVIVTVENIVSTDYIRKYSSFVSLPGYLVKAVCHVPFGAHPQGMISPIPGLFESYAPDYEFVDEHREACQDPSQIDNWIKSWVLECRNQEEYVEKLGATRIKQLRDKAAENYWKKEFQNVANKISANDPPNGTERMILAAAQKIEQIALKNNYKILLGGIGASLLSAWTAYYLLRDKNYDVDLASGTGILGFAPRPGDPFYGTYNNLPSSKGFFDTTDLYGFIIAGQNQSCISILGAAQIDKYGNINSTRIGDNFLIGSGGANDATNASEVLVVAKQSKRTFVDRVSYVTCPGRNIRTIVTDMGVFEKAEGDQEFTLTACILDPDGMGLEERMQKIRADCNWDLRIADKIEKYSVQGGKALYLLRSFDPERFFLADKT